MSNTSATQYDFSDFEAQFGSLEEVEPTEGQLRVRGWIIVLAATVLLWGGIGVAIAAAFHALS